MRCNVDGDDRPKAGSDDWVDDARWGVVHQKQSSWHTVTGTRLLRVEGVGFIPRGDGPVLPGQPIEPGLPGRPAMPDQFEEDE